MGADCYGLTMSLDKGGGNGSRENTGRRHPEAT